MKKKTVGGGAGCAATIIIQPLDLIKTRLQLNGELGSQRVHRGTMSAINNILKQEGFFNLYNGLSAALLRQLTYTTIRMGTYQAVLSKFEQTQSMNGFHGKLVAGMIGLNIQKKKKSYLFNI